MKEIVLNKIKQYNVYLLILLSTIICLLVSLFFNKTNTVYALEETKNEDCIVKTIKIDIKGLIKNPGVYEMNENDRVIDVINKAGGLLEGADTSSLNLSEIISDAMVINILSKTEIEEKTNECICEEESNLISINKADANK